MGKQAFPTSFGQQRLWFLDQITPGTTAYNLARALRLTGSLSHAVLAEALRSIVSRHESLRTIFTSTDGEVKQVVLPALKFDLLLSDLSELPSVQRERTALRIAGEVASKPFDLSAGPLLRAQLLRLGTDDHILVVVIHHIITDGWSMNLLFHEIGELYAGLVTGRSPRLPKLKLQYSDYSRWQRALVTGEFVARELDYWKAKLHGAETVLQLPTDHPRPTVHSGRGKTVHFELNHETNKRLEALAQSENATLFMVLLAVFDVLLARYTLQDSILIGTAAAGRHDSELENLIGFFVNTLILRADPDPDSSFRHFLRQIRATTLEALAHQDMPFEKLVEALEPDRNLNRNPLFQVMFVLHNTPKRKVELPGLLMQEIEFESGVAKFDLTLEIIELGNLHCRFEYDSDLYEESTIRRMAGHFAQLVDSVVAAPDDNMSQFSLLTAGEARQLAEWNDTVCEYPRKLCIHTAFEEQVKHTPNKTAIIDPRNRLSYDELNKLANRLARRLITKGLRPATLVGISLNRSIEMVIALLAILKTGAAYVPVDPAYPKQRLDFMVDDSQINLLVTTPEFVDLWEKNKLEIHAFDFQSLSADTEDTGNLSLTVSAENRMYVLYTSGSTGTPKGIEGTHRASMNRFSWMWNKYPFFDAETCCQKTFLGFVDSVWEIFGPLLHGVTSVILPNEAVLDPEQMVQLLSKYEVTRIVLVPSLLQVVLEGVEDLQNRLPKLKLWTCSGEVLSSELVNRFSAALPKASLLNIYGSSEVAADVTWHEITMSDQNGPVPIGRPISNVQTFILDSHLNQVPVGVPGELYVGGDCLSLGYFRRPELTSKHFISHDFEPSSSVRLFRTGDLGRYMPNGEIEYLGRTDNQVKIRGIRVELGEIEGVLASQPKVRDAVVVLTDRSGQQGLTAYIEIRSGQRLDADELRRFMRSRLPEYMVPSEYLVVDAFPLLPSGKVDRRLLALQMSARPIGRQGYVAPETPTQERLVAIWRSLLGTTEVGITDNFFQLGGHSLMIMQVVARIRKEFEVEVPIRSLFEDPTIKGLAKEVEEAKANGIKAFVPISSFLQTQNTNDRLKLELDKMSHEELEELLKQLLKEGSSGSAQ